MRIFLATWRMKTPATCATRVVADSGSLEKHDPNARQWYPRIVELATNPETEYRLTVAWAMGFDNRPKSFIKRC